MTRPANVIRTRTQFRDGWHAVTSPDMPGLFIAHSDLDLVCDEIPRVIRMLYSLSFGVDVRVLQGVHLDSPPEEQDEDLWVVLYPDTVEKIVNEALNVTATSIS